MCRSAAQSHSRCWARRRHRCRCRRARPPPRTRHRSSPCRANGRRSRRPWPRCSRPTRSSPSP
ncbi:MAG: hypothetical protein FJX35_12370 [Alphaproteobacteria bacterium]|nr:hypothetical protein [Alphaproteobacteria bacterium]